MSLEVLVAPLKAPAAREHPQTVVRSFRQRGADIIMPTEAYPTTVRHALAGMHDYRLVVEEGGADKRRGQHDNPILVRDGLVSLASGQVFGSGAAKPDRIAPERWMTFQTVRVPGVPKPVCTISLHPHAAVQTVATGNFNRTGRAVKYQRNMERLDDLMTFAESQGWWLVVGGDLNYRDRGSSALSPFEVLKRHQLEVTTEKLTVLAADHRLKMKVRTTRASTAITDHGWLLGSIPQGRG